MVSYRDICLLDALQNVEVLEKIEDYGHRSRIIRQLIRSIKDIQIEYVIESKIDNDIKNKLNELILLINEKHIEYTIKNKKRKFDNKKISQS